MPERDCSKHILRVKIDLDQSKLKRSEHYNLIAALLRQIADYTDGWCSTEHAKDSDLAPGKSMAFYFTTEEKRKTFKTRIGIYLSADIDKALSKVDG